MMAPNRRRSPSHGRTVASLKIKFNQKFNHTAPRLYVHFRFILLAMETLNVEVHMVVSVPNCFTT